MIVKSETEHIANNRSQPFIQDTSIINSQWSVNVEECGNQVVKTRSIVIRKCVSDISDRGKSISRQCRIGKAGEIVGNQLSCTVVGTLGGSGIKKEGQDGRHIAMLQEELRID